MAIKKKYDQLLFGSFPSSTFGLTPWSQSAIRGYCHHPPILHWTHLRDSSVILRPSAHARLSRYDPRIYFSSFLAFDFNHQRIGREYLPNSCFLRIKLEWPVFPPLAPRAGVLGFDDPGRDEVEGTEVFPLPLPFEAGIVEMTMMPR